MISERRSMVEVSDLFIKIGRIQFMIMAYILFGFILFGKVFVSYWAGDGYEMVYPLTVLIMIPQTIPLIQNLGISVLQALNRQRFRSFLNVIVALISVAVGYELTKKLGIIGCAISTAGALFIGHGVILNWYYLKKIKLDIIRFWSSIMRLMFPILTSYLIVQILLYFVHGDSLLIQGIYVILYTLSFILMLWFYGFTYYEKGLFISVCNKIKFYFNIK